MLIASRSSGSVFRRCWCTAIASSCAILIDVILRERFYHLETLTEMSYSDQIKYGVNPQHVRALQAEVEAVAAPAPRHPSPRGATGLDWRPHDDL